MNLRRHKHFVQSKVWAGICIGLGNSYWQGVIDRALTESPEEKAARDARMAEQFDALWGDMMAKQAVRQLVEPEPTSVVFTVARKKGGEIVGTFDSLEQAQAEIDKAKKAKKATLVLV